jgi:5-hydroxyisourate hydrolase-like protein (transthyretin family)
MKQYILLLSLLGGFILPSLAQSPLIKGYLLDQESHQPLDGVIVKLLRVDNHQCTQYTFTDNKGFFTISLLKDKKVTEYQLQFTLLGYESKTIPAKKSLKHPTLYLHTKNFHLKEVKVMGSPIRAQGDTINYTAAHFIRPGVKTLEDIIKRLPGLKIDYKGKISYKGKYINRFYIENLDMLGGDYTLATENIEAKQIASIQVLANHQPIKVLENVEFSEEAAINIKLKNKQNKRPYGSVYGGGGILKHHAPRYHAGGLALFFNKKQQAIATLKAQNDGSTFQKDNVTSQFSPVAQSRVNHLKQRDFTPSPPLTDAQYKRQEQLSITGNALRKLSPCTTFTLSTRYGYDNYTHAVEQTQEYYSLKDTSIIQEATRAQMRTQLFQIGSKYEKNAAKTYLLNHFSFSLRSLRDHFDIVAKQANYAKQRQQEYAFKNKTQWIRKVNQHVFEGYLDLSMATTPESWLTVSNTEQTTQTQKNKGWSIQGTTGTKFSWLLSSKSVLTLDEKLLFDYDKIETSLVEQDKENNTFGSNAQLISTLAYQYKSSKWIWHLEAPITLTALDFHYRYKKEQKVYQKFIPYFGLKSSINYQKSAYWSTRLRLFYDHTIGDITPFITDPILVNYRTIQQIGSGQLPHSQKGGGTFYLHYKNPFKGFFADFSIMGLKKKMKQITAISITDEEMTVENKNRKNTSTQWATSLYLGQNLPTIHTILSFNGSYTNYQKNTIRQGEELTFNHHMILLAPSIDTSPCSWLGLKFCATWDYSQTQIVTQKENISNQNLKLEANFTLTPIKNVEIFGRLTQMHTRNAVDLPIHKTFLNMGCRYERKSFVLECNMVNLTNVTAYERTTLNQLYKSTQTHPLNPFGAYVSLKMRY